MELFYIITGAFLVSSIVFIVLTHKAGKAGHADNEGRFYYVVTLLSGIVYTVNNVIHVMG